MQFTAEIIAGFLNGEIVGDPATTVSQMAKIEEGTPGSLSFLANPKYEQYIYTTNASIVIVNKDFTPTEKINSTLIKVEDAYSCFAKLLELYVSNIPQKQGVSKVAHISDSAQVGDGLYLGEFAVIGDGAKIGNNCKIYPHVYVGDNVKIGDNVTLYSGVKIYEGCVLGSNIIIHSGAVIGSDGFGFAPNKDGTYSKIPQIGNVVIEDDVEIGSNSSIDRATMGSTIIKKGVKLDNLIQIAHNVVIGENTVAASQTGIAGSTKIGKNCMFGGQVGIVGHLNIGDRVHVASKSGILENLADNTSHMGIPSLQGTKYHRSYNIFKILPDLKTRLEKLEKLVLNTSDEAKK